MGGVYCEDCDIAPLLPADTPWGPGLRTWGADVEAAGRLWTLSERLTGASFAAHCA